MDRNLGYPQNFTASKPLQVCGPSPNDESQKYLFDASLGWTGAINICEKTGTAFSDSMILNALKASKLFFTVSLDFDIGYAALSDPIMKDVVVPDRLFKEYKHYHFPN